MNLELLKFIEENQDWKRLLGEKPFCVDIKENDKYMIFVYSMIDSDFSLPVVKECRGIILRKKDYKPVCIPFFKFHNVQESLAAKINWSTARVQEKIDGSLIKVWYEDEEWHVSTNGTIDAREANLSMDFGDVKTYYDLFCSAENASIDLFYKLNKDRTYMFEIVSPFNRVVIPYTKTEIWHIGTRDNTTFEELNEDIGIQKPKEFPLKSLDECLAATAVMPFREEGYVCVDSLWKRVKVKSPAYVACHHMRGNGVVTANRILDLIKANAQDDFLSIYPEFQEPFEKVENGIKNFLEVVNEDWNNISKEEYETRKDLAMVANKTKCPAVIYSLYDKKYSNIHEWFWAQSNERILSMIGIKE